MSRIIDHDLWQEEDDLQVVITHNLPTDLDQPATVIHANEDGITLEFYLNGDLNGKISMTYDEWFEMSQRGYLVNETLEDS